VSLPLRERTLRAAVLGYLALLVLAAVPAKVRPAFLEAPGRLAGSALEAVAISPGLAVFSGSVRAVHRRAACLEIRAERPGGAVATLYANACPPTGFRWRVDPWDEMVEGLVRRTRIERFARDAADAAPPITWELVKLQAVGDFFCHSPRAAAGAREAVTLEFRNLLVLYSSGLHTEDRAIACRWRCGTRPFAAPACRRLPRAHERG
jgi:hypothetical protein